MRDDPFVISADPARKLLRVTLQGFWDASTIEAYDKAIAAAGAHMAAAGCPLDQLLALVDTRGASAQSQDLIARYKDRFQDPRRHPHRLATVVSSALLKRQVERIGLPNQRIFADERDALEWVMS